MTVIPISIPETTKTIEAPKNNSRSRLEKALAIRTNKEIIYLIKRLANDMAANKIRATIVMMNMSFSSPLLCW
jgi:hypothetical protein